MIGIVLGVAGMIILLVLAAGEPWSTVSFAIYGFTAVVLYSASSLLHGARVGPGLESLFRRLDHAAIFIFIAGCYTPITLIALRPEYPAWAWAILGSVWGLAIAGTVFKMVWFHAPRWLSTALYLLMGWISLVAIVPLWQAMPAAALIWLAAGGLFYTVGAVVYALKKPDYWPGTIGYHGLWHIFVLAGTICHFVMMLVFVLPG